MTLLCFLLTAVATADPYDAFRTTPRPPMPYGAECTPKLLGKNLDVGGHDLDQTSITTTRDQCNAACCAVAKCGGVLFEPESGITWNNCTKGKPCCFLKTSVAGSSPSKKPVPGGSYLTQMMGRSQDDEKLHFLSATLGSHMVLQRAPQQAVVWGFTAPNASVTTTMHSNSPESEVTVFTTIADPDGTWRQSLPATPASKMAYNFTFASSNSSSERAQMVNVLFGDVYLCGGNQLFKLWADPRLTRWLLLLHSS